MSSLLVINSSPLGERSVSRTLTAHYTNAWTSANPGGVVIQRDASAGAIPHIDGELIAAFFTPPDALIDGQRARMKLSDELIAELVAADEVVFGVSMHNFGVPSSLKSYIDHIVRVGVTFRYNSTGGIDGLIPDRKTTIVVASGNVYAAAPMAGLNHADTWLQVILGFVGIRSVHSIHAGGLALGDDSRNAGIAGAQEAIADRIAA
jgi:FMN-dependent NADH-azoreductase